MSGERHIPIQWLRAIAALAVVAHHAVFFANDIRAPGIPPLMASIPALPSFGAAGVDLFFVISGFVMAQSIAADRPIAAGGFLLRRAIRIMPLFWIASLALLLVEGLPPCSPSELLNSLTLFPLFDSGDYHAPPLFVGWTLGFEILFYMLVAAVLALGVKRRAPVLIGLTTALAIAGLFTPHARAWESVAFNPILGEFALGIASWMAWRRGIPQWLAGTLVLVAVPLLLSGIAIDVGQGFSVNMLAVIHGEASLPRLIVWGIPSALLLTGMVASAPADPSKGRWLEALGVASYMLYLVHPIVVEMLMRRRELLPASHPAICAMLILLVSTVAALLLHRHVERPLLAALQARVARFRFPAALREPLGEAA